MQEAMRTKKCGNYNNNNSNKDNDVDDDENEDGDGNDNVKWCDDENRYMALISA